MKNKTRYSYKIQFNNEYQLKIKVSTCLVFTLCLKNKNNNLREYV